MGFTFYVIVDILAISVKEIVYKDYTRPVGRIDRMGRARAYLSLDTNNPCERYDSHFAKPFSKSDRIFIG